MWKWKINNSFSQSVTNMNKTFKIFTAIEPFDIFKSNFFILIQMLKRFGAKFKTNNNFADHSLKKHLLGY